ncbi:MAG: hypothetical protein ACLQBX_05905 [Candidatus Limnocylindrales bacterium]
MTATLPRPVTTGDDNITALPTSPLRVYARDHQPIRLLAEMEGVSAAELLHRALQEYLARHGESLAEMASQTRERITAGDLDGLAQLFETSQIGRRRRRAARLAALSQADTQ